MTHLSELYEQDFHAWALQNAGLIRAGRWEQIDTGHLAEELEDMGASKQQQLESRLRILLGHLLKWCYQPQFRSRSWQATVKEQRYAIMRLLQKNPSLQNKWDETLTDAYRLGGLAGSPRNQSGRIHLSGSLPLHPSPNLGQQLLA